jgi:hypothetical protein
VLQGVAPPVVSDWCQELAIAPRVRLYKSIESCKPSEREIYDPEVARVGLGHSNQVSVSLMAMFVSEAK